MAANFLTYSRRKWRGKGYYVEGTEQISRVPGGLTRRHDLFGFCDLLALPSRRDSQILVDDRTWVFIQVTSWGHVSTRLRKIQNEKHGRGQWEIPISTLARHVLERGDKILIEGWKLDKGRWICKERWLTLEDLE